MPHSAALMHFDFAREIKKTPTALLDATHRDRAKPPRSSSAAVDAGRRKRVHPPTPPPRSSSADAAVDVGCQERSQQPASSSPPPKKRRRGQDEAEAVPAKKTTSFEERDSVADGLLSLLVPGGDPLPVPVVGFLLQNQTGDGAEEEVEIDVYAFGDKALFVLKKHVEECLQEKERSKNLQSPRSEPTERPEPTEAHLSRADCLRARHADIIAKSCRFLGRAGGAEPQMATEGNAAARPSAEEAKARRKREIKRQREEARRALDEMVRTVEFNDPNICPEDVLS